MPKVGEIIQKTVVRYGKVETQQLIFCEDGRWHFHADKPKKQKPSEPVEDENPDVFEELFS